jgi:phosphomannomutase
MGGAEGTGLTPIDVVKFTAAFCTLMQRKNATIAIKVVVGRDARISGPMVNALVCNTLVGMGAEVIDLGLSTTPTVEVAVPHEGAHAGIILTASHNPLQWNALKLLNEVGEFISADEGAEVLRLASSGEVSFAEIHALGSIVQKDFMDEHIRQILELKLVDQKAIQAANLHVAVDAVNSSGGVFVPALLDALGVKCIETIHCTPNGHFPHNPEPLPEHLTDIIEVVKSKGCQIGLLEY